MTGSACIPADPSVWAPDALVGPWEMKIDWRARRRFLGWRRGAVMASATIFSDASGFGMEVRSPGSDSRTRVASWSGGPGSPELHYVYDVTPRAGAPQGSHPYTGAAILRYYSESGELRGNYWTSQLTVGEFTLVREAADTATKGKVAGPGVAGGGGWRMRWLVAVLLAAMVAGVLWFLILGRPDPAGGGGARSDSQQTIDFAVGQASRTCLLNLREQEQRSIETGVTARLRRYAAGGYATIDRTRQAVNETLSERGQLEQQRILSDCMIRQTDKFVERSRDGGATAGSEPAGRNAVPPGVADRTVGRGGPARGYVYYEEDGGQLTRDGVFGSLAGAAPAYGDLKRGRVLKSVDQAQLRSRPSGRSPLVATFAAGQCVRIEGDPIDPASGLTSATSGGRLRVVAVSCP